jgi:hypothetical protein
LSVGPLRASPFDRSVTEAIQTRLRSELGADISFTQVPMPTLLPRSLADFNGVPPWTEAGAKRPAGLLGRLHVLAKPTEMLLHADTGMI